MIVKIFCSLVILQVVFTAEDPILELPTGKILGRQATTFANTTYYSFQKIPFAAPPVGPLRFKAPQPVENWENILDATVLDVNCYQLQGDSPLDSEDCLVVNVYTPQLPEEDVNTLLPVMFYIYGGGFTMGTSIGVAPDLFVDNGVILVTVNYRLGPFGFLSTEDEVIPGNNGLKDQKLAIQWTHDNIHLFGGDPEQITIFGESAGSASVTFQLLNQENTGLFRAAILESGTFLCPWAFQRNPRETAFATAAVLNATFDNGLSSIELLEFLQNLSAEELDAAAEQLLLRPSITGGVASQGSLFAPVIEVKNPDAILTRKMFGLLNAGNILRVPTLVGFNSEEGLLGNENPDVLQSILNAIDDDLDLIVPDDMEIDNAEEHADIAVKIRDIYTVGEPFGTQLADGVKYNSDNSFNRAIAKYAELFSGVAETYFYEFSYDGELGGIDFHYDGADSVGHTEELHYIFCSGEACDLSSYPESDQLTSKRLIKIWTDFAKSKNPTPEPSELLQNITWPVLSVEDGDFLYVDINEDLEIKNHPKGERLRKWNELYDSLTYKDFDTY